MKMDIINNLERDIMLGTIVNMAAVILGSGIGMMVHSRLPQGIQKIVFQGIGLSTGIIGMSMALKTENFLVMVLSVVLGSILGQATDLERRINSITARFSKGNDRFVQGFITATMLYCIGSMTILGAIEDGLGQYPTLLYTKSLMDGMSSVALAASFGVGVMFSAVPLLIYQGGLTLCAAWATAMMSTEMMNEMTAVGGLLLVGLALNILDIKHISIINMLPSLIFAVVLAYFLM